MSGPGRRGLRLRRATCCRCPAASPTAAASTSGRSTGRVAVHPLGLDGDVQVNRKHHGGEGQAVYAYAQEDADFWIAELGRELPAGPVRREPAHQRARPARRRPRRAVAGRDGAVRGHRLAHPVRQLRPLLGRARPGQAVRRARRHRRLPAGAGDRRASVPATPSRSSPAPTTASPSETAFRIVTTEQARLPELAPALRVLPLKDQPKLAPRSTPDRRSGLSRAASGCRRTDRPRATVRRVAGTRPADGEVAVSLRRRGVPLLALALLAGPVLAGCCGGASRGVGARPAGARQAHPRRRRAARTSCSSSEGAPNTGTSLIGGEGDIARPVVVRRHAEGATPWARPSTSRWSRSTAPSTRSCPSRRRSRVIDPAQFGFGDPGALLDPDTGISQLLGEGRVGEAGGGEAGRTARSCRR